MNYADIVSKAYFNTELKKMKKKEQELYKFILNQFLELEEFKKKFSNKIKIDVDKKVEHIEQMINEFNENKNEDGLTQNIELLKSETKDIITNSLLQLKEEGLVNLKSELENLLKDEVQKQIDQISFKFSKVTYQEISNVKSSDEQQLQSIIDDVQVETKEQQEDADEVEQKEADEVEQENLESAETEDQEEEADEVEQENLESAETEDQEEEADEVEQENLESAETEDQEEEADEVEQENLESTSINYRSVVNVSETTTISELENINELLKSEELVFFLRNYGANRRIILPVPTEQMIGKTFLILNTNNSPWVIAVENGIKINNQFEKNLIRSYHYLRLITDGEKYFLI
jgi:hypothetical protein